MSIFRRGRLGALYSLLAIAAISLFAAAPASAASITFALLTKAPSGSNTTYTYSVFLSADADINNGDFFVITDFAGYVSGSEFAPLGFTASTEATTGDINPGAGTVEAAVDSASVTNLRFTYDGSTPLLGPLTLTGFGATSTYSQSEFVEDNMVAQDTNKLRGVKQYNTSSAEVPLVPTPGAATAGFALLGLVGLRRRRTA